VCVLSLMFAPPPDIAFRFAVERFVAEAGPGLNYAQLRGLLGHRDAAILKLMGDADYEFRQIGREMARARGESAWQLLAWGASSPDGDVRSTCERLLIGSSCPNCRGRGYYAWQSPSGGWRRADCRFCGGTGCRGLIR
jgi:hypothetical protein